MTLRDEIAADCQAAWFDTDGLAQTATYTPKATGVGVEIPVIITYGDNLGGQGRYILEEMVAQVRQAEVETPKANDLIALESGEIWTVRKVKGGDGLGIAWLLGCTRYERAALQGRP